MIRCIIGRVTSIHLLSGDTATEIAFRLVDLAEYIITLYGRDRSFITVMAAFASRYPSRLTRGKSVF